MFSKILVFKYLHSFFFSVFSNSDSIIQFSDIQKLVFRLLNSTQPVKLRLHNWIWKFSNLTSGLLRGKKPQWVWSLFCHFASPAVKCLVLSGAHTPTSPYWQNAATAIMDLNQIIKEICLLSIVCSLADVFSGSVEEWANYNMEHLMPICGCYTVSLAFMAWLQMHAGGIIVGGIVLMSWPHQNLYQTPLPPKNLHFTSRRIRSALCIPLTYQAF